MRKRLLTGAATALLTLSMVVGSAMPAFAYYDSEEEDEYSSAVTVEEYITETEESEDQEEENTGALTPEGNMNLVDDVEGNDTGLQYLTVTTRDGSYFYIIIDRSAQEENVYFLNQVDATDLLKLMSDEEKEAYTESQEEAEKQESEALPADTSEEDSQPETKQPEDESESPLASSLPMLGVFVGLGALIAGGYYVLKIKPKKNQGDIDEDREFYDDDEYENEDVEEGN